LCAKLELVSLRQLNQRIAIRYHLRSLEREEIVRYIKHRLGVVSSNKSDNYVRFTDKAIDVIYKSCKGTPRMINIICDRALLAGYTMETFIIDTNIINRCVKEVDIKTFSRPNSIQSPQQNFESEKIIVDTTIKRCVWYKNIYVLVLIFFAVVGSLYTVLYFFGLTSSPKPSDQSLQVLSNASDRSGLQEQKNIVPSNVLHKPVFPVHDSVTQSDMKDKTSLPGQKSVVPSNVSDKPVLPAQETVAQLDVAGNSSLPEQKSVVSQKASDKSVLPTQKNYVPKRFRLLKSSSGYAETVAEKYTKGSNFYGQGKYKEAFVWFHKAAEHGHAKSQSNLGVMYSEGQGVEQDDKMAVKWFRRAADRGYAQAQTNLCIIYSEGKGVEQDYIKAAKWCRKAAGQGNGQAQAILGLMYSQGQGVEQDTVEAVRWYKKASEQGVDYAKDVLKRLEFVQE